MHVVELKRYFWQHFCGHELESVRSTGAQPLAWAAGAALPDPSSALGRGASPPQLWPLFWASEGETWRQCFEESMTPSGTSRFPHLLL